MSAGDVPAISGKCDIMLFHFPPFSPHTKYSDDDDNIDEDEEQVDKFLWIYLNFMRQSVCFSCVFFQIAVAATFGVSSTSSSHHSVNAAVSSAAHVIIV